jgi:hypothetical protein
MQSDRRRNRPALDPKHRLAGLALLLAACGSSLLHRHIFHQDGDAAAILQMALVLIGMALASIGTLLILYGARLFAEPGPAAPDHRPGRARRRP